MKRRTVAAAAATAGYLAFVRPWMLRWGSTEIERLELLPGDELLPDQRLSVTRAIDIEAPRANVWPWLVQVGLGSDRAGFYSYDALENLIGLDIHSSRRVMPALQGLAVGDRIPLGHETHLDVARLEPNAALVLRARMHPFTGRDLPAAHKTGPLLEWTWAFVLREHEDGTRLLLRTRGRWVPPALGPLIEPVLEPVWFVMERRMLLGIRDRAEGLETGAP